MPPVQLLPELVQIKPQYDIDVETGNHPENILWFKNQTAGTPTLANLTTIANTFDPLWANIWKVVGSTAMHYTGSVVTDFSTSFGLVYSSVGTLTPIAGSEGGIALPPNVSALISLRTGEHYRGGHFRIYLPWLAGNALGSNQSILSSAAMAGLTSAYLALEPGMNSSGVLGGQTQRCYRHRYTAGAARLDAITTFSVNQILATQRRRLRKAPHR